jgi:DNA-binding winged helix-turn-helix (wHTH) protein/Tol biopolymer transport system component
MRIYEFGDFRLDVDGCTLLQNGRPVALTPKAFDTLVLLVENHGRLLEKETMLARLWPGTFVEEANLANNVSLLRKVLGGSADAIQTVPRRGYRFAGDVKVIGEEPAPIEEPPPPRRRWPIVAGAAAIVVAAAAGLMAGRALSRHEPPSFTQITFRRGIITGARLDPDGETIVYSASYEGRPAEIFTARLDQRASRPFGLSAHLLSISKHGELAVLTKPEMAFLYPRGTLARVPLAGGAPREIVDNVEDADWSPDGGSLAILHWTGPIEQVEWPINKILYKAAPPAWVSHVRVSPDGRRLAILLHESERFDDRGRVVIFDPSGRIVASTRVFTSAGGITWTARGDEIWLSASPDGLNNAIYAVDGAGRDRVMTRSPARLMMFDAAADGTSVAATEDDRTGIIVKVPGETNERELSWLDGSWLRDVSDDGRTILFDEEGTGGGATARVYTRTTDGAPAVDLGAGHALALSPDGKWVLARQRFTKPPRLVRIPTGAGQAIAIGTGNVEPTERASWLPDGRRLVFVGSEPGRPPRTFLLDVVDGRPQPVTPEGTSGFVLTPDGAFVLGRKRDGGAMLFPLAGGTPHPIVGLEREDVRPRFSNDGLVIVRDNVIQRIDLATGARKTVATYGTARPSACIYTAPAIACAGGRGYAYTYMTASSDLFAVRGLR